ncbi:shikimate kinase [Methanohalophilus levihalophilus]|uniref:shikimate kinase n=1 Tax=Methanohalophilus levihalophilus TaxID=1431282 RepID=UPI001AE8D068|nr:shikimate kinase [Methanohalophilus levihalophilus]MBP2029584.1 shikimate kinase [Methanohalophilus levihalophilus]
MSITLIGMAGVGKSTLGRIIAKNLGLEFIDVDELIKKKTGSQLQAFIETHGDDGLMKTEEEVILSLKPGENYLISTGGSAIYSEKAMSYLKEWSTIVLLEDSFSHISSRIRNPNKRGLVGLKDQTLKELFLERRELYRKYADITVDLRGFSRKGDAVNGILTCLTNKKDLLVRHKP